ncbi:MAG TPA: tetratricopeptide repeat protein [Xanthobacteraceae bacterium]|nr:tetratricopeptide repeat protein [Xanthobacteraceae bacterium]
MPFALQPGTMITGYEVVRAIGAGGFGITYEGFNPITERRVAIKEFFPRGIASRDDATRIAYSQQDNEVVSWALKRFAESTNRLAKLKHPNIIEVLNYVADNGTGYMVMEHVDGTTLEDWLRERSTPPQVAELGPIFDPVFDALEYVHSSNLVHRDIAPDNIMIRKTDGRPMLIDFGALKIIEQHTRAAHAQTPKTFGVMKQNYSAPEQSEEGGPPDPRLDIYSLAATIYRALCGKPPVDSDKRKTDLALRGQDSYIPMTQAALVPVAQEFAAAIDAAMSLRPEGRPSTIREFRERLAARGMGSTAGASAEDETILAPKENKGPRRPPAPPLRAGQTPPPAYAAQAAAPVAAMSATNDPGQASAGAYTPPGGETATVKRSGISWLNIAGIAIVLIGAIGVLLHRPVIQFIERMTNMQIMSDRPQNTTQQQTQPQQRQQQPQQKQLPQQQTQPQQQTLPPASNVRDSQAAFERGLRAQRDGNNQQAITDFNEAIRLDPNNASAYASRGLSYYRNGDATRAYADYSDAIRLAPDGQRSAAAYANRAIIQRERGNIDRGFLDAENAIRLDPRLASAYNTRGNLHYDNGNHDAAIADYNQALTLDPQYAVALSNRGNAYYAKRDYRRAIDDYSAALRINPRHAPALVGRGNAYDQQKNTDQALKDYSDAIRANRDYVTGFLNRGRIYLDRRDFISALSDFSDAVRLDPKHAIAHQGRGLANEGLGRRNEAVTDLRQALRLDPKLQRARDALRRLGVEP